MKKMNNKGFSLIELIIVIAIMAILVAIIAPNLTKYLGSSKKETDKKNLDEVVAQVKNCISDASIQDVAVTEGYYKYKKAGNTVTCLPNGGASIDSFGKLIVDALDGAASTSKEKSANSTIKISITARSNGGYDVKAEFVAS